MKTDLERFKVVFNEEIISHLSFAPQLGYALGLKNPQHYDEYVQYGSGLEKDNFDYFRGSSPFQRGYGIQRGAGVGDVFRGLWRFFLPILRRVGTTVGSEALSTGQRVLERVGNEGVPFKEALVSEGKRGIDTVLDKGGLPRQYSSFCPAIRLPTHPTTSSFTPAKIYIALSKCYLLTEFRIRKENNNGQLVDLTVDDADIAPIQMIGQTFIRNIKMTKDSHLNAAGYYRDMGDALEIGNGFIARRNLFAGSNVAQFIAKIDTDLFNQPLYLINFCELDIEILPNDNAFVLIAPSGGRYHFEVVGLKMYVKKVSLMDGLALDIAQKLESIQLSKFNVREISITANGRPYPQAPYDLDYSNGKYVRPFNDMNEAVGFANSTESNGITFAQYGKTHCIYVFNLGPTAGMTKRHCLT
ncbi:hypothetical protein niasHS_000014 [Heterodera schachtii]|uniref:Uncharacterized protein n=1 Tax=Heterodera schachtii TaxID=97005 RepID=A0ABD2K6E4_HETSC